MKRALFTALVLIVSIALAGTSFAGSATKEECITKSKEAAQMITDKGLDVAIAEINKKDGQFVWKDTYVFLMDLDGKMLAHPMNPSLIGKNLKETPDKDGKMFFQDFIQVATGGDDGWVDYMWPKPGEETPSKKLSYIYRVPGKDLMVGAGIYE